MALTYIDTGEQTCKCFLPLDLGLYHVPGEAEISVSFPHKENIVALRNESRPRGMYIGKPTALKDCLILTMKG